MTEFLMSWITGKPENKGFSDALRGYLCTALCDNRRAIRRLTCT